MGLFTIVCSFGGRYLLIKYQKHITSSNPDSDLWCMTVIPVLQMGSRDSEGQGTTQKPKSSIRGNWDPPSTRSDLLVPRAHALKLERTKKSKMFPRPATLGSEFLGLSASFCFFLALYQNPTKMAGITQLSFTKSQPHATHGR